MLTTLRIKNFTIVSSLELDFNAGMSAFTGETGAGKSILYDALLFALGARADASVIRPNADACDVLAVFNYLNNSAPARWLDEHDVVTDENIVYLRRTIQVGGRSKSYINGIPFPLHKLKELSAFLVDIHGQHQHQSLLYHATHREHVDRFAQHTPLLKEVEQLHRKYRTIKDELHAINQEHSKERVALLQYQIDELSNLDLDEGEMQRLHEEHRLLHHAKEYLEKAQHMTMLFNGDEPPSLLQLLNHINQLLSCLPDNHSNVRNAQDLVNSALIHCDEALHEIMQFTHEIQLDPERLHEVETRISVLHQTARKYHIEANQLPNHLCKLQQELEQIQSSESKRHQLEHEHSECIKHFEVAAMTLRTSRQKAAKQLENEITKTIRKLGMPHGKVLIDFSPLNEMQSHGLDKIEYKVCTNPGMKPDSLNKIASGGELSRIGLAIHMITAQNGATPTLLFDEVDVGIGGSTAALVGQLLKGLGQRLQVFCITHQAQVASSAHHHFLVQKQNQNGQTYSSIKSLNEEARVEEIARMLGGLSITEQTLSHARELLAQCLSNKDEKQLTGSY